MKWSWKLGTFAGIDVFMHITFVVLLGWVALNHYIQDKSLASVIQGVGFILALFACVVAHEYGHALTARRYGIKTRDITLLPIGGVARLERMPDKPVQELWVALAGPAVNVVIALVLFVVLQVTSNMVPLEELNVGRGSFIERLLVVNVSLVVFNLLPAFPMDGGRVVRALLAMRMEYTRATQIAASLGQTLAIIFGFIGLFTNPFLLFIALFVWIGAAQEASMTQMKAALAGIPTSRAMLLDFRTLSASDTVARAVDLILAGSQHDFPVTEDGKVVGILTRKGLMSGLAQHGTAAPVTDLMQREFETFDSHDMLETAFARLQACQCQSAPVTHDGRLVGLLTQENVGEFLMIQAVTQQTQSRPA